MADDIKKQIHVEILADAKQFRDQIKSTAKEATKFNKDIQGIQKAGGKEDKTLRKASKDFLALNKKETVAAIRMEKQLSAVLKDKAKTLKSLTKLGKTNTEEYKREQAALKKTASLYAEIKKSRLQASGPERKEQKTSSGSMGTAAGVFMGNMASMAFGAVIGAIKSRITDAIDAANEYNAASVDTLGDSNFDKNARSRMRGSANVAGFSATEAMKLAGQTVRQTGRAEDAGTALQLSRAAMVDQGKAVGFMGLQARGGLTGSAAKREQEKIIAAGFASGMQRGRLGEFLEGVSSLAQSAQGRTAGDVSSKGYADLLAAFGKSGKSGLQGSRGAAVLQQLEQGVMSPGAGEAGQALVLRSKGFGTPGGTTDYYTALRRQQMGFTGEKGAGELKSFVDQLQTEYGKGSQAAVLAGSNVTGVSIPVMEQVMKVVNTFSGDSKKLIKQIGDLTKGEEPLDKQVRDILSDDVAESLKHQVKLQDDLVKQGLQLVPMSLEIKEAINEVTKALLDVITPVLKDIFLIAKDILHILPGGSTARQYRELDEQTKTNIKKAQEQASSGKYEQFLKSGITQALKDMEDNTRIGDKDATKSLDTRISMFKSALKVFDEAEEYLLQNKVSPSSIKPGAKSLKDLSAVDIERAAATGIAKGLRSIDTTPKVQVNAVARPNIYFDGNTRISNR